MKKFIVMTFATTPELKALVEQWAAEDERSVSQTLRLILNRERDRRAVEGQTADNRQSSRSK